MLETSARLLQLLSLLQVRREWTGPALAERMGVTERTVRRDVGKLRSLGYPINASPGVAGGYQLGAGAQLPPLLLDDDEAVAVALGLSAVAASPVAGVAEASVRALTKLEQVLPGRLRPKFGMLRNAVTTLPGARAAVDPEILTSLSAAITDRRVVGFRYAKADGESSRRLAEPYGLVDARHRWYLVAWDLGREDWRTFRADRFGSVPVPRGRFTPRPLPGPDLAGYVHESIVRSPYRYDVVVRIDAPVQQVAEKVPPQVAELEDDGGRTVLRAGFDSLEYPLIQLAGLGFAFEIIEPVEFRDRARELGSRLREAGRTERPASP